MGVYIRESDAIHAMCYPLYLSAAQGLLFLFRSFSYLGLSLTSSYLFLDIFYDVI